MGSSLDEFNKNVNETIDDVNTIRDNVNEIDDMELANSLLTKNKNTDDGEVLSDECFKKYITYMKANCFPVLTDEVIEVLSDFYVSVRQQALASEDGKPITARDLKSLERLTIARAKCEGRTATKLSDAEHAIRIYNESLETLGLDLTTAGEIIGILSDKELGIISDVEKLVKARVDFEGLPLSQETVEKLGYECGVKCTNTSLDPEGLLSDIIRKVNDAL